MSRAESPQHGRMLTVNSLGEFMSRTQEPIRRPLPRPLLRGIDDGVKYLLRSGPDFYDIIDDLPKTTRWHPIYVEFKPKSNIRSDLPVGLRYAFRLGALEYMAPAKTNISASENIAGNTTATAAAEATIPTPFDVWLNHVDKFIWLVLDQDAQDDFSLMEFTDNPWDSLTSWQNGRPPFDAMRDLQWGRS